MRGNKLILLIVLALVVIAAVFFAGRGGDQSPEQQPSPHAIDQSN